MPVLLSLIMLVSHGLPKLIQVLVLLRLWLRLLLALLVLLRLLLLLGDSTHVLPSSIGLPSCRVSAAI